MIRTPKQSEISGSTQCGNERHPDGPWHPAQYLSYQWWHRFVFWRRKRKYGCSCPVAVAKGGPVAVPDHAARVRELIAAHESVSYNAYNAGLMNGLIAALSCIDPHGPEVDFEMVRPKKAEVNGDAKLRALRARIDSEHRREPAPRPGSPADIWYSYFLVEIDRLLAEPDGGAN